MYEYKVDPFEKFNNEWALVTAGTKENFNTMTISWGSMGTLWHKSIVTVYIRPDRFTYEFLENSEYFTVSFYDEKYKEQLTFCGRNSGRDVDKVNQIGFQPKFLYDSITFEEAKETIVLKKIYSAQMDKSKFSEDALKCYSNDAQAHYMIIGEVINIIKNG